MEGLNAWLVGDVLTKLDLDAAEMQSFKKWCVQTTYCYSTVHWSAVEHVDNKRALQLYYDECVVWEKHETQTIMPPVAPFQFELTSDLPQCLHIHGSQLTYQIVARLHHSQGKDLHAYAPFHPRRYIKPGWKTLLSHDNMDGKQYRTRSHDGDADYSLEAIQWACNDTIQSFFWLERNIIRHVDSIRMQVHIPPPSGSLVVEKGLQLQCIEASLTRVVQSHPNGKLYTDLELLRYLADRSDQGPSSSSTLTESDPPRVCQHLIVFTGKSCRFHSQRPIHICLSLFPGSILGSAHAVGEAFDLQSTNHELGGRMMCESVTQNSLLQNVRFVLKIRVVIRNEMGEHRDVVTQKLIKILPSPAGLQPSQESKESCGKGLDKCHSDINEGAINQAADVFSDPHEYDGYDDSMREGRSMRVITLTNPESVLQWTMNTAPVEYCEMSSQDPPPSIYDHANDAHVPDYVQFAPTLMPDQEHSNAMAADMESCDEEPPNFDEVSCEPQPSLTMAVQAWHTQDDYTAPPLTNEVSSYSLSSNHAPDSTQSLPPSYVDSTCSSPQHHGAPSPGEDIPEQLPPAYAVQMPMSRAEQDPVFPPLYEA